MVPVDDPTAHPAIAHLPVPPADPDAEARLADLLDPSGTLAEAMRRFTDSAALSAADALTLAERLVDVLGRRTSEDLEGVEPGTAEVVLGAVDVRSSGYFVDCGAARSRLVLGNDRRWTVLEVIEIVTRELYPGRHLARVNRPAMPAEEPSAEATVLRGMELVGREVLLGDHELAWEVDRLGRRLGRRWDADRQLAVRRALEDLVPAVAHALVKRDDLCPAPSIPIDALLPSELEREQGPKRAVAWLARAGAPGLVREWLTVTGQTGGLRRLVTEPLTPVALRHEVEVGREAR